MNWKHVWFQLSGHRLAKGCDWFGDHPLVEQCSTGQITLKPLGLCCARHDENWQPEWALGSGCEPGDLSCVLGSAGSGEPLSGGGNLLPWHSFLWLLPGSREWLCVICRLLCRRLPNEYQLKAGILALVMVCYRQHFISKKLSLCLKIFVIAYYSSQAVFRQNYLQDSKQLSTL